MHTYKDCEIYRVRLRHYFEPVSKYIAQYSFSITLFSFLK